MGRTSPDGDTPAEAARARRRLRGDRGGGRKDVADIRPGDEVFGGRTGALGEYVCVRNAVALKPANLTFEQAAAVPTSGFIAIQGIHGRGRLQPGQRVLINGAGGAVGAFAVQLAKAYRADVTGVDSTAKLEMVRSLGADRVIDYTKEDFTRRGEHYDLILDVPGIHRSSDIRRALTPTGTYVLIGHDRFGASGRRWIGGIGQFLKLLVLSPFVSQRMAPRESKEIKDPLGLLKELVEAGKITPVIDRTFPLSEVREAIRYLAEGHARGRIIITM